jgi:hypothetical protein
VDQEAVDESKETFKSLGFRTCRHQPVFDPQE